MKPLPKDAAERQQLWAAVREGIPGIDALAHSLREQFPGTKLVYASVDGAEFYDPMHPPARSEYPLDEDFLMRLPAADREKQAGQSAFEKAVKNKPKRKK